MAYCFQFKNRETGKVETLSRIDELVCEMMGVYCKEKRYSPMYQMLTIVAMGLATNGVIDQPAFEQFKKERGDYFEPEELAMFERFLLTEYEYSTWYGR